MSEKAHLYFLEEYHRCRNMSPYIREARALSHHWRNIPIFVDPDQGIIGWVDSHCPFFFQYGGGTHVKQDVLDQMMKSDDWDIREKQRIQSMLQDVHGCYYDLMDSGVLTEEEFRAIESGTGTTTFFNGHMVVDYPAVLGEGLNGIRDRLTAHWKTVKDSKVNDFYQALSITLDGMTEFIMRHAQQAIQMAEAETDPQQKQTLLETGDRCQHLSAHPPRTFLEALQMVWFIHGFNDYDSFGRFDQYLFPFYREDIENGRIEQSIALGYLKKFVLRINGAGAIQNMTIGGIDVKGSDAFNDLSFLILRAVRESGMTGPNLCVRVHSGTETQVWDAIYESLSTGQGLPAIYNDEVYLPMLEEIGIPREDAWDFSLAGCSQVVIPGRCNFANDVGIYNILKCLELALYEGKDILTGKQAGPATPPVREMKRYEDLLEAFWVQTDHALKTGAEINNKDHLLRQQREGYCVRSLLTRDCIEKGEGIFHGGARYNHIQSEIIGISNASNALAAVKEWVYRRKEMPLEQLVEILVDDFRDHESLRLLLKNRMPKFGNDQEEVDGIRKEISERILSTLRSIPAPLGGCHIAGEVIFVAHDWMGKKTGATPDGRKSGDPLADSAGAAQGTDLRGPTALLNSTLKIPQHLYGTSCVVNMKFIKNLWNQPGNREIILSVFRSYFERGGMQLQINVCDRKTLEEARIHPEQYQSLVVRVGGYSDYFVRLSDTLQQEIIERTAY